MLGGCVTHAGRSAFRGQRKAPREVWTFDAGVTLRTAVVVDADGIV